MNSKAKLKYEKQFQQDMNLMLSGLSGLLAFVITFITTPKLMKKMKIRDMTGRDVNKKGDKKVPEMGGIAAIMGFAVAVTVVIGIEKLISTVAPDVILAVLGTLFMTAFVGLVDDISVLSPKVKVALVTFAALPIMIVHMGSHRVNLPLGLSFTFPYHFYWLILVPFAITGAANAINLSAGANGLETGETAVISAFLLVIALIKHSSLSTLLIFSALLGAALALYYYNKFPAKTFVGDVGTLSMGALIAAGSIIGNIQLYGAILLIPVFVDVLFCEVPHTIIYRTKRADRTAVCKHPIIHEDGRLEVPKSARTYDIRCMIMSRGPISEKDLVRKILMFYGLCGVAALILALL